MLDLATMATEASLTGMQTAWLLAYLGEAELDAAAAASIAGYANPADAGCKNRRHPVMREIIAEYLAPTAMSRAEIIARIEVLARRADDERVRLKALELLGKATGALAQGGDVHVHHVEFVLEVGRDDEPRPVIEIGD